MSLDTGKVAQVPVVKGTTPGTPIFTRSGDTVLYVAYENGSTRLGLKFVSSLELALAVLFCFCFTIHSLAACSLQCYNRPCKLYAIRVASLIKHLHKEDGSISLAETIEESSCCLTPDDRVSLAPRISPCGNKLVW